MPGTGLDTEDTSVDKTGKNLCSFGTSIFVWGNCYGFLFAYLIGDRNTSRELSFSPLIIFIQKG